jgi:hypothetical protein
MFHYSIAIRTAGIASAGAAYRPSSGTSVRPLVAWELGSDRWREPARLVRAAI